MLSKFEIYVKHRLVAHEWALDSLSAKLQYAQKNCIDAARVVAVPVWFDEEFH